MNLPGKIQKKEVDCEIDSGAEKNFISQKLQEELQLSTKKTHIFILETADKRQLTVNKEVEAEFELLNISHTKFKVCLKIMKNLSTNIILGTEFLQTQKCVLDYENATVTIRNNPIEIQSIAAKQWTESPDKILAQKTKAMKISKPVETSFYTSFIKEKIKTNPIIGCFPNIEHEIRLISDAPITGKSFSIPVSLKAPAMNNYKNF